MRKIAILAFVLSIGSAEGSTSASFSRHTSHAFSAHGEITTTTDPVGNRTAETVTDTSAVLVSLTTHRPLGDADHRWVSTWDEGDRLATLTDPQGHTTSYRYDAHGNRTHANPGGVIAVAAR